jgi:hypothetical protein
VRRAGELHSALYRRGKVAAWPRFEHEVFVRLAAMAVGKYPVVDSAGKVSARIHGGINAVLWDMTRRAAVLRRTAS